VPDNLRRTLVGVPLHLRYQDSSIVVDEPDQVLIAPDKSVKKKSLYTCAALDSALVAYLGEPGIMLRVGKDRAGEQPDVRVCAWVV
jgi:hypothetical protein